MGIIVMSFPGCGKQTFINKVNENVPPLASIAVVNIDECDRSSFREDFIQMVDERSDKHDVVFVPFNKGIMNMLDNEGIDYDLFYPESSRRLEFIQNFVVARRKRDDIVNIDQKWNDNQNIVSNELSNHCHKHCLGKGEFIGNNQMINDYINSLNKK